MGVINMTDIGSMGEEIYKMLKLMPACYELRYKTKLGIVDKFSPLFISIDDTPNEINIAHENANNWITEVRYKEFLDGEFDVVENTKYEAYTKNKFYVDYYIYDSDGNSKYIEHTYIPEYGTDALESKCWNDALDDILAHEYKLNGISKSEFLERIKLDPKDPKYLNLDEFITITPVTYYKHSFQVQYKVEEYVGEDKQGTEEDIIEYYSSEQECLESVEINKDIIIGSYEIILPPTEGLPDNGNFKENEMTKRIAEIVMKYYTKNTFIRPGIRVYGNVAGGSAYFNGLTYFNTKPLINKPRFLADMDSKTKGVSGAINNAISSSTNTMKSGMNSAMNTADNLDSEISNLETELANTNDPDKKLELSNKISNLNSQMDTVNNSINSITDTASKVFDVVKKLVSGPKFG